MIDPRREEEAAWAALEGRDHPVDPHEAQMAVVLRELTEAAALLAYDAPQIAPPPSVREALLRKIGTPSALTTRARQGGRPRVVLPPALVLAACLMGLVVVQAALLLTLDRKLSTARARLAQAKTESTQAMPFADAQLAELAPLDNTHGNAKIMVAWDPHRCRGMVSLDAMPPPPPGSDYQLWVLNPSAPAPINAGVVARGVHSQSFAIPMIHTTGRPGFAVSLEPAGGRPTPTQGAILFAVAPSL